MVTVPLVPKQGRSQSMKPPAWCQRATRRPGTPRTGPAPPPITTYMGPGSARPETTPLSLLTRRTTPLLTTLATPGDHRPDLSRGPTARDTHRTRDGADARARKDDAMRCPECGHADGFLVEVDDFCYRVLEDAYDTEMLDTLYDAGIEDATVTCLSCKAELAPEAIERVFPAGHPDHPHVTLGTGRTKNRTHMAGKARLRVSDDGRTLPMCPECGATHDFLLDLEGAAYHVLEDDDDTDLLEDAANLLCTRCSAVFDL